MERADHLSNARAKDMKELELHELLLEFFAEVNDRQASADESEGLREAAQWIREGSVPWSRTRQSILGGTWDPTEGPRAIYSEGG